jgi:processive 1,2-diacylglycerol beta-glucosyltransferase
LPTETVSYLKAKKKIASRLITVITDFGVHDFWMSFQTDNYIVGTQYTRMQLMEAGVKDEKILVWGIPVEEKFFQRYERKALAKKIGVGPEKFTVLISTGSFGLGIIEKAVKALYPHVQLLVVCANNIRLFKRLERLGLGGVKIYGFVPNIEELMAVSDLIITKPGGLTISECLSTEIVPVFITAIYGQESENLDVLLNMGIGLDCRRFSAKRIKGLILDLAAHPEILYQARNAIKALNHIFPVEELRHVVCVGSSGLANQRAV